MIEFIVAGIFWILAIYGMVEILKTIYKAFTYVELKNDDIHIIIAVKNEEEKIEGFLRSVLFRIAYGEEDIVNNIIITDLDSTDGTKEILTKLKSDYDNIEIMDTKTFKEFLKL